MFSDLVKKNSGFRSLAGDFMYLVIAVDYLLITTLIWYQRIPIKKIKLILILLMGRPDSDYIG